MGAKQVNVAKSLEWIGRAAVNGARLIVLPELANSGYVFRDRAEAFALAEEVPAGETTAAWMDAARRYDAYIVAGIAERAGTTLRCVLAADLPVESSRTAGNLAALRVR